MLWRTDEVETELDRSESEEAYEELEPELR
jgi:hypothetical protein